MGSYQNPVGGPDPYEKYRVDAVGEKQNKRDPQEEAPPKENQGVASHILQILRSAVDYFLQRHADSTQDEVHARENFLNLKTFFETMQSENRSQDLDFLNGLSKSWNKAIEESLNLHEAAGHQFKALVKKILHYPENQSHTLGYYLTEYAGQKWVPFPYMELIAKIHSEHEKNPSSSPLTEWVLQLNEVISLLNEK